MATDVARLRRVLAFSLAAVAGTAVQETVTFDYAALTELSTSLKSSVVDAYDSNAGRYDPNFRPPPPVQVAQLDLTVYPNPVSLIRTGIQLRLKGNASVYKGRIYDLLGRKIGDFDVPANGRVIWDGKDEEGRMVKPGVYLVNVEAGGRSATVRVAVLR